MTPRLSSPSCRAAPAPARAGFTLIELLVSLVIVGMIFAGAVTFFFDVAWRARDQSIITATADEAQAVMQLLASELRLAGSGVPFTQANFAPGGAGLGDAPLPILTASNAVLVSFRTAKRGVIGTLSADYTPSNHDLTFTLVSAAGFAVGDTVYLSNMPRGGSSGLRGTIAAIGGSRVTIRNDYVASTGAVFEAGSIAQPVQTVTYDVEDLASGIVRSTGASSVTVASRADFTLQYLDKNAQPLALPLTAAVIGSQLAAVRVTLNFEPRSRLRNHPEYLYTLSQTVTLRNLLIKG